MSQRIVITGANGQLGQTLMRSPLFAEHTLLPLGREDMDITVQAEVSAQLDALRADVIINAAAYTAVDAAESHPEQAYNINEQGVKHLARWAKAKNARMLHISTDFVFAGDKNRPYRVDDATGPVSVYGESKLAGEKMLATLLPSQSTIVRTAWLYSPYNSNFMKTMLRLMRERDSLHIIDDQLGTPCSTASLVTCLHAIVAMQNPASLYHWTDAGTASWYDFAVAIQEEALALALLAEAIPIHPIATEKYKTAATRPPYSVLDKSKALLDLGCPQVHWREALREALRTLREQ